MRQLISSPSPIQHRGHRHRIQVGVAVCPVASGNRIPPWHNTQGGTIVLGVAEKAVGLVWEGVPDAAQLRTVLWGQLNDRHKVSANLLRDDDVRTVEDGAASLWW